MDGAGGLLGAMPRGSAARAWEPVRFSWYALRNTWWLGAATGVQLLSHKLELGELTMKNVRLDDWSGAGATKELHDTIKRYQEDGKRQTAYMLNIALIAMVASVVAAMASVIAAVTGIIAVWPK
jgi:hypothetical protein